MRKFMLLLAGAASLAAAACNTVEGAARDVQAGAEAVEGAAQDVQN